MNKPRVAFYAALKRIKLLCAFKKKRRIFPCEFITWECSNLKHFSIFHFLMFRIRKKCESRCNIKTGIKLFEEESFIHILNLLFKFKLGKKNDIK